MAEKNMLVCFDGTELSAKALDMAIDFAKADESVHLDVAYVAPIPALSEEDQQKYADLLDMLTADCRDVLYQAQDQLSGLEGRYETFMVKGSDPAAELLKLIGSKDYYLAVIGSRGLSGIKGYVGSVSYKVLQNANIPVLIAK